MNRLLPFPLIRFLNRVGKAALCLLPLFLVGLHSVASGTESRVVQSKGSEPFVLVVTDPLSDLLACDCVEGYAQRNYELLGKFLQAKIGRPVEVFVGDSIESALRDENQNRDRPLTPDLVIGKHSMIAFETREQGWKYEPIAQLTGKDGGTTQWGLVVVRRDDPALVVDDLEGYRILFGHAKCDEKHMLPRKLFEELEIELPADVEIASTCGLAAKKILDSPDEKIAAVISSYAIPLLEGCGTINKGDLRVIGETEPTHFISAFICADLDHELRGQVVDSLMMVAMEPKLAKALESRDGFVSFNAEKATTETHTIKKKAP